MGKPTQQTQEIHVEPATPADAEWTPGDIIQMAYIVAPVLLAFVVGYWAWKKIKIMNKYKNSRLPK